ncbi:MAG TPA: OmpA family protein [Steroidobacteraceae bacterium]|nr:OmpA family protein [Steroidobacteraceae bacterium]
MKQRYGVWAGALALALAGTAQAGELPAREVGIGMLSGAASGALVGGPPGAIVGFMLGAIVGDRVDVANRAEREARELETRLAATHGELEAARLALARAAAAESVDDDARFLEQLAARLSADVLFRTGSDELEPDIERRLTDLAGLLGSIEGVIIELHGFADPRGDAEFNRALSERRAERVRGVLLAAGLDSDRTRVIAHGEDLSTAPEDDTDAYAWERRVRLGVVVTDAGVAFATETE